MITRQSSKVREVPLDSFQRCGARNSPGSCLDALPTASGRTRHDGFMATAWQHWNLDQSQAVTSRVCSNQPTQPSIFSVDHIKAPAVEASKDLGVHPRSGLEEGHPSLPGCLFHFLSELALEADADQLLFRMLQELLRLKVS